MRIHCKFRDYYDTALGYGIDPAIHYNRQEKGRRYSVPVTINNPQQVDIAAEGGQQVNVQSKGRGSQKGTGKNGVVRHALAATSGERVNLDKARKVKARA